ncbi:zinc ribbon domain-containing protein [Bifidobacterium saguinibicoloris]|uniref:zinc ribbon domain-containing protein n=1 Tax=Bifidobacterium saguinibicoloris TaxID=2834433 RepID=UPI001C5847E3|nr:zinc ribbon domain-containing protein [Bifidobacterium saguinibicoloris]MBW3081219.1 zinc ribbon domain-containing protein [Bifidobacterium saguinibicoloris]
MADTNLDGMPDDARTCADSMATATSSQGTHHGGTIRRLTRPARRTAILILLAMLLYGMAASPVQALAAGAPPTPVQSGSAVMQGAMNVMEVSQDGSLAIAERIDSDAQSWYLVSLPNLKTTPIGGEGVIARDSSAAFFIDAGTHTLNRMDASTKHVTKLSGDMTAYKVDTATRDRVLLRKDDDNGSSYAVYDVSKQHLVTLDLPTDSTIRPGSDLSRLFVVAKEMKGAKTEYTLRTYNSSTGKQTDSKVITAPEGFDLHDMVVGAPHANMTEGDKAMFITYLVRDRNGSGKVLNQKIYRLGLDDAKVTPLVKGTAFAETDPFGPSSYVLAYSKGYGPSGSTGTGSGPVSGSQWTLVDVTTGKAIRHGTVPSYHPGDDEYLKYSGVFLGFSHDGAYVFRYQGGSGSSPLQGTFLSTINLADGTLSSTKMDLPSEWGEGKGDSMKWSAKAGVFVVAASDDKAGTTTWRVYDTGTGTGGSGFFLWRWLRGMGVWDIVMVAAVALAVIAAIVVTVIMVIRRRRYGSGHGKTETSEPPHADMPPVPEPVPTPVPEPLPVPMPVSASETSAETAAAARRTVPVPMPVPPAPSMPPMPTATGTASPATASPATASSTPMQVSPVSPVSPISPSTSRFCARCGAALGNRPARFCPQCGSPVL